MDKETLFKEIRRQQVLLWAGAGFSRYAGYPMGKGVVEKLYAELSQGQRQQLAETLNQPTPECPVWMPLPDFAQQFVNLHYGNKQKLIEILDSIFSASPTSIEVHNKLSNIAFIDKIVTTNYDLLFELAYGSQRLHVVTKATNVPQGGNKDVIMYKIHGELRYPESLIITKDDYYGFFEKADDVVWTQVRALMATRTILFVGYAVEDPNILDVFLTTLSKLGQLMRPAYVVGPEMPPSRVEELRRKNIYFIQATGEQFIEELLADIKKNSITDLKKEGATLAKPVSRTLSNLGLNCEMTIDGSQYLISDIRKKDGKTVRGLSLALKDAGAVADLTALLEGQSVKPVRLTLDESNKVIRTIEGFDFPADERGELIVARTPKWGGKVDIKFESGYLLKNVNASLFYKMTGAHIIAITQACRIEIVIQDTNKNKVSSTTSHLKFRFDIYDDLNMAKEYLNIMSVLGSSQAFDVIQDGNTIWSSKAYGEIKTKKSNPFTMRSQDMFKIVEMLEVIEKYLKIDFRRFSFDNAQLHDIAFLYSVISNIEIKSGISSQNFSVARNEKNDSAIASFIKGKLPLLIQSEDYEEELDILGWKIKIKWREVDSLDKFTIKSKDESDFHIKTKSKFVSRGEFEVLKTEIIARPKWLPMPVFTEEQLKEEVMPHY